MLKLGLGECVKTTRYYCYFHVATCADDVREDSGEAVSLSDHGKHLT